MAVQHLIKCCHFEVRNLTLLQTIDISMGIDPAPSWANLHLSKHEYDFMDKLIKEDIECYWFLKSNKWLVQIIAFKSIVRINLENCYSDPSNITCRVPQGSILGPFTFLIYMNEMPQTVKSNLSIY